MVLVKLSHNMKKRKKWGFPLFRCLSWYRVSLWGGNKGTESTYQAPSLRAVAISKAMGYDTNLISGSPSKEWHFSFQFSFRMVLQDASKLTLEKSRIC